VCLTCNGTNSANSTAFIRISMPDTAKSGSWGQPDLDQHKPLTLYIGDRRLILPTAAQLVLGRAVPGDKVQPDVDLGCYEEEPKSISRRHAELRRRNGFVYVLDLDSVNGTRLNGHPILANVERLLRDCDDLQLGKLNIKIRYIG